MNSISFGILTALHIHKQICGTEELARIVNATHKEHALKAARILESYGMIEIVHSTGGRGRKNIFKDKGVIKMANEKRDPV